MYYYLILALQVYCVYDCYTSRKNNYWYFVIIFLPLIGCLIYLFAVVIGKRDVDAVQKNVISVIHPTKKITELAEKFKFAETFENQIALADAYMEADHNEKAIEHYEAALKDVFQNDFDTLSKLEEAYYFSSRFEDVITCAEKMREVPKFKKSRAAFLYGLALEKIGKVDEAEEYLKVLDAPFSRYQERLELSEFYIRNAKMERARVILQEIVAESESMSKIGLRLNRITINKAKELLTTF